jgi:hypothetical protein
MNDSIKNLKNLICREFNAPSYNLKMYKTFFTYKKIDEEGNDVPSDEASAGASSHT